MIPGSGIGRLRTAVAERDDVRVRVSQLLAEFLVLQSEQVDNANQGRNVCAELPNDGATALGARSEQDSGVLLGECLRLGLARGEKADGVFIAEVFRGEQFPDLRTPRRVIHVPVGQLVPVQQ